MAGFYEIITEKTKKIDNQLKEIDTIKPVDELHKQEIAKGREILLAKKIELENSKKAGDEYRQADTILRQAESEAQISQAKVQELSSNHNKLKEALNTRYPGSYDKTTNTIHTDKLPSSALEMYYASRIKKDNAILDNNQKQINKENASKNRSQKANRFSEVLKKINSEFPNNTNLDEPCTPCELRKRNKKLARVKKVFEKRGQQHYGNCGVQSSSQVIELITCKSKGEAELLKEALKNDEAGLTRKDGSKISRVIDEILGEDVPSDNELIDEITDVPSDALKNKIETSSTGGTSPDSRETLLLRNNVDSVQIKYTRESLANSIKANKVVIPSVDAYSLNPAYDENGNKINNGWEQQDALGSHAVVIADGKFDRNGNLTHVLISDTGCGMQYYMKIDDFERAVENQKSKKGGYDAPMNVSVKPINENCVS